MEEDTKRINEEHITSSYSWIGGGMRINISTCQQPPRNEEAGLQKKDLLCLRAMKTKTARGRMLWFPLYCQISVRTKTTRTFASSFSDISARPAIPFNSQYSSSSFATSLQWSAGIGTFAWIYWKCVGGWRLRGIFIVFTGGTLCIKILYYNLKILTCFNKFNHKYQAHTLLPISCWNFIKKLSNTIFWLKYRKF